MVLGHSDLKDRVGGQPHPLRGSSRPLRVGSGTGAVASSRGGRDDGGLAVTDPPPRLAPLVAVEQVPPSLTFWVRARNPKRARAGFRGDAARCPRPLRVQREDLSDLEGGDDRRVVRGELRAHSRVVAD